MANESVSVSGPVEIESISRESVAFQLMRHISGWEEIPSEQKKNRRYWLALYRQCYKATIGSSLESILKEE